MRGSPAAALCAALLVFAAAVGGRCGASAAARPGGALAHAGGRAAPASASAQELQGRDGPTLGPKAPKSGTAPARATAEALVVGVTFEGAAPPVPLSHFRSVFFGTGPSSVASYFKWASYGAFDLRGKVVGGSAAGQAGDWLVVPHSAAYYAQGNSGMGDAKKPDATSGGDLLEKTVVRMLDKKNFDWKPYEDAHGNVPYLILLVNSPDAALTGSGEDLWSYEESGSNTPVVENGAKIGIVENYDMDAALAQGAGQLNGVGTFDHEFSHILGALDMYDTNNDIAGLANWSLMGSGNYNGPADNGTVPSDLGAFTRVQFGWSVPKTISGPPVLYRLPPAETSPEVLEYPIPGTRQYYLMENRQPIGSDSGLPGHGLLIDRVDGAIMNPSSQAWINDCLECVSGSHKNPHPGIEVMQSDGTQSLVEANSAGDSGSGGDPFPGVTGNRSFSDTTKPSAVGWGGVPSYLSVSGITQEANGDIVMAAGTVAAQLSPSSVGQAGGTVTIRDALNPFARGDVAILSGAPADAIGNFKVESASTASFDVAAGTPPGAYLLELKGSDNVTTPLAYLTVTDGAASDAPAALAVTAARSAVAGAPVSVTVQVVDAQGDALHGNFGAIWIDGAPAATTDGVATAPVASSRAGPLTVSAALYRLPSVVGHTTIGVSAGPAATIRFAGPTHVVAGETALYRVVAKDRFGNPVTTTLVLRSGQAVVVRHGRGQVRLRFTRAGVAAVAVDRPRPGAVLAVHVRAGAPYRVASRVSPAVAKVGQKVRITALARDAYGNLAVGSLTLSHTTHTLRAGRATFTVTFGTAGKHVLHYRVADRSTVGVYVRGWFPFNWL